jgi:hypothetical protein
MDEGRAETARLINGLRSRPNVVETTTDQKPERTTAEAVLVFRRSGRNRTGSAAFG